MTKQTKDSSSQFKFFFPKLKILNDSLKNVFLFTSEEDFEIKKLIYNKEEYTLKDKINIKGELEFKNGINVKNGKIAITKEYIYLGEWFNQNGTNKTTIEERKIKINYYIEQIKYYGNEFKIGKYAMRTRIKIYIYA